jgi:hypothetical protein
MEAAAHSAENDSRPPASGEKRLPTPCGNLETIPDPVSRLPAVSAIADPSPIVAERPPPSLRNVHAL